MTIVAAIAGTIALAWLTLFQLMLAAGAPLGHLAWGGEHRILPPRFRRASAAVAGLTAIGTVAIAQVGGLVGQILPASLFPGLLWAFAALFGLSLIGNLASRSPPERAHGVPLTLIIASCSLWLALTGTP
ncbi:hypothetical protein CLV78_104312 [Aliiruegeria haliotis]|uniref:Uncharacterized protein n=1 Tax=Aliiruegeria haliotis TaxID=1280846 RepID=A0A2T0RRJ5_9RHOB|nr:hypothetical protein [Aliiruegeria haliotis]PRY23819.1 hypothetical protein CLV78_104312 [Aliiruegeria haliotis]